MNRSEHLFVSPYTGTGYSYDAYEVYVPKDLFYSEEFVLLWGGLPRVHDVRHSFCTASLNRMLESGDGPLYGGPDSRGLCWTCEFVRYGALYSSYRTWIQRLYQERIPILRSLIPEVCDEN